MGREFAFAEVFSQSLLVSLIRICTQLRSITPSIAIIRCTAWRGGIT